MTLNGPGIRLNIGDAVAVPWHYLKRNVVSLSNWGCSLAIVFPVRSAPLYTLPAMEKASLRSGGKRKGRLNISAPRQISSPIPQDGPASRPAMPGAPAAVPTATRPRPPPMNSAKVSSEAALLYVHHVSR